MEWNGMEWNECASGSVAEWNECASGSVAEWNVYKMSLIIHFIL
jgi:hypothetical protein